MAGSTFAKFSLGRLARSFIFLIIGIHLGNAQPAPAPSSDSEIPLHMTGDRKVWDRKNNIIELYGSATVNQKGETISAEYIRMEVGESKIFAQGNVTYITGDMLIQADEIEIDGLTHTGVIRRGKVANQRMSLLSEAIQKEGDSVFEGKSVEYTTCHDCPGSWSLLAESFHAELEGYAHLKNVTAKVKDIPVFWFPYLIIPLKTVRQSGFLFPRWSLDSNHGFTVAVPYFWAISRSMDATLVAGYYSNRGLRGEGEFRYIATSDGRTSGGFGGSVQMDNRANRDQVPAKVIQRELQPGGDPSNPTHYTTREVDNNPAYPDAKSQRVLRWGFTTRHETWLPWNIGAQFYWIEVSDMLYPNQFGDIPGSNEPVLTSDLVLRQQNPWTSQSIEIKRHRSLTYFENPLRADPRTVQLWPRAQLALNDRRIPWTPFVGGVDVTLSNFSRLEPSFYDSDDSSGDRSLGFRPGVDPIRKGLRTAITPRIGTHFSIMDRVNVLPSIEYRSFFYHFYGNVRDLARGYLLFQTEANFQMYQLYETDDPDIPRYKHLIRPLVTYHLIPWITEPAGHPFIQQSKYRDTYRFDNHDIVPYSESMSFTNYYVPLGHSISYGGTTQWIRRRGRTDFDADSYHRFGEISAGQTLNIMELSKDVEKRVPLTRFFYNQVLELDHFRTGFRYTYMPFLKNLPGFDPGDTPHAYGVDAGYSIEQGVRQGILVYDRSFSIGYNRSGPIGPNPGLTDELEGKVNYSLTDHILPSFRIKYDFSRGRLDSYQADLNFQSFAKCWRMIFSLIRDPVERNPSSPWPEFLRGLRYTYDFTLNLTGSGFLGLGEVSQRAVSR